MSRILAEPRIKIDAEERLLSSSSMAEMTEARRCEIKEILELRKQDIVNYDAEIHRLQLRRQEVKHCTDKLLNLLSPIHYLPNELLMRIFEDCCDENDLTDGGPGSALIISAVCTRWREIAIAHPGLWTSLKVFMDCVDYDEYGNSVEEAKALERLAVKLAALVEVYLHRSQSHPLSLDIAPVTGNNEDPHPALTVLVEQSRRWKSLIYRGFCFSPRWFSCLDLLSLPMLDKVSFSVHEDVSNGPGEPPASTAFALVPRISELTLYAVAVDSSILGTFSESWNSLTTLSYDTTWAFDMLWEILDLCPKLRKLEIKGRNRTNDTQAESSRRSCPPKTLASVSSLLIIIEGTCANYDTLGCLLASLTLSNLTELTLEQLDGPTKDPFTKPYAVIEQFLRRSKCALASLTLNAIHLTDKEAVALLLRLPFLQKLSIADPSIDGPPYHPISRTFIEGLHAPERNHLHPSIEPLLPNLRCLTLKVASKAFAHSSFIGTVESRWLPHEFTRRSNVSNGVVCLRSVELHLSQNVDTDVYGPLKRLDAAGMRVVVKCKGQEGYIV